MEHEDQDDVELEEFEREEGDENESEDDSDEDEDDDESGDDDDDDDDDDENEEEDNKMETLNEAEFKEKFGALEKTIAENPYGYDNYVAIIKLLRDNGEFKLLRDYRTKMSEIFPLSENLWLDWLKDEQKFVETKEDRDRVDALFQKAVEDYLSVDVWLEYIQYSIGGMGEPNGIENIRNICEKAILFAGFHVTKGYVLWEAYREFENAMLAGLQQSTAGSISSETTKKLNEQIERIVRLFKLQLGVCLDNLGSTMEEFKQFDDTKLDERTKTVYEKRLEQYKKLKVYEDELVILSCLDQKISSSSDATKKLAEYRKYIDFELNELRELEKQLKGKSNTEIEAEISNVRLRLKCLFERAIADGSNCLDQQLWLDYIEFLGEEDSTASNDLHLKSNLNVIKRASRNCPWSSKIWVNYALVLEQTRATCEEIKGLFNQAMNSGLQTGKDYLQIWHAYLDFMRRYFVNTPGSSTNTELIEEIRDSFQKAIDQLYNFFKNDGDPLYSLEKYWSLVEAKYFKSIEKARKIWNEQILKKGRSTKYAADWLEFYELECQYGDEKHQRKLLNRALNEVVDTTEKEIIFDLLFKFEKLNGNVSQFNQVYLKYERFKQQVEKEKQVAAQAYAKAKQPLKKDNKNQKDDKNAKNDQTKEQNNLKRKTSNGHENSDSASKKVDQDGFAVPTLPSPTEAPTSKKPKTETVTPKQAFKTDETKNQSQPAADAASADQFKKPANINSNLTVFISNLNFEVDEEKIKAVFEKEPGFKGIRLIKHWSGKNKGYGYVDFERPDQAQNALKLDRTPIDGRPVFISPNEDKSLDFGQKKFRYATNLEKNKLFVSGLPFSADKAEIEKIFGAFGKLKEVRIVTYKSGKSKGLAYVDFEDEKSASTALMQTDGMLMGENQISVAISNPPKKKGEAFGSAPEQQQVKPEQKAAEASLGSGAISNRAPTTQTAMSFLPRAQLMNARKKTLNLK